MTSGGVNPHAPPQVIKAYSRREGEEDMKKTIKKTVQKLRVLVQIENKVYQVDLTENQGLMILDLIRQILGLF